MFLVLIRIAIGLTVFFSLYSLFVLLALKRPCRADHVHTVTTRDGWRLRLYRYAPRGDEASREPILIVHGANANHLNLAMPAGESLVDALAKNGFDCWCIDLRGCRSSVAPEGHSRFSAKVDDYVRNDIPAAITYILRETGQEKLHALGYSMGGMMLYAHTLINGSQHLASLMTIGSPPGFDSVPGLQKFAPIVRMAKILPAPVEFIWRMLAPLYPSFRLNFPFAPAFWPNMHKNAGPDVFFSVAELLPADAAEHFLLWATEGHQWHMMGGTFDVEMRLKQIQIPTLVIVGIDDPLTPIPFVERFFESLHARDKHLAVISRANRNVADYSHLDLVWGRESENDVFRVIIHWLAAHPFEEGEQVEVIEHPR